MAQLYAGTSGFAYDTWRPDFYPAGVSSKKYLSYYAQRLNSVEINYTYHRLPSVATMEGWVEQTPATFVFVLKAHQKLTHIFRLKKNEFTQVFFKAIDPLRWARRDFHVKPVLRDAVPGDLEDLLVMMRELYESDGVKFSPARARRFTQELMDAPQHGRVLVIEVDSAAAGYCVLTYGFSIEYYG